MCQTCWEEHGSPRIVNERTLRAAELVRKVYETSIVGGGLHVVVDDFNIEDSNLNFCKEWLRSPKRFVCRDAWDEAMLPTEEDLKIEEECLQAFFDMTVPERASALAIHDQYFTP